jgi:hypothetical protein
MRKTLRLLALVCIVSLFMVAGAQVVMAAQVDDPCALPVGLDDAVSREYPDSHIVSTADFNEEKRGLFQKEQGSRCPGLVTVDFYGDGKQTLALVLGSSTKVDLVIAHQDGQSWNLRLLESFSRSSAEDTARGSLPVYLVVEGPGKYSDGYEKKTIRATHQVIVFAEVKAWAVLYAWTGKKAERIVIQD